MRRSAHIDPSGRYRYSLRRVWAPGPRLCCVMLNPSTADATNDDPTLRRVMGFARAWGYGSVEVVNLFALRSPRPADLRRAKDPIGPGTPSAQRRALARADGVLLGWGGHGHGASARAEFLRRLARVVSRRSTLSVVSLAVTKQGEPAHPLYQPTSTKPRPYVIPDVVLAPPKRRR